MKNSMLFKMKIVSLLTVIILASCDSLRTVELAPDSVAQDCTSAHDRNNDLYCPGGSMVTACLGSQDVIASNSLKTFTSPFPAPVSGWEDQSDPGTQPLACWEWVSKFSRAYVRFDPLSIPMGPVENIQFAALTWTTKRLKGKSYEPSNACIKSLFEATGPWKRGGTPATLLFSNLDTAAVGSGYYGVVQQVKKWYQHPDQNFGFMIEPARADTLENGNWVCLDALEGLKLVIKYRPEKFPSP